MLAQRISKKCWKVKQCDIAASVFARMEKFRNGTDFFLLSHDISYLMGSISIVAFAVGAPGNILIIHSVRVRRNMQNPRNYFILNLACCDIILLLFFVPLSMIYGSLIPYNMPEFMCKTVMATFSVLTTVSMCTHVAIALERRRAIVFPLLPKPNSKTIKVIIFIVWIVSATAFFPVVFYLSGVYKGSFCALKYGTHYYKIWIVVFPIVSYAVPIGVMTWAYQQIICGLRHRDAPTNSSAMVNEEAVARRLKNQRKTVKCLIALVCSFVLLTFPNIVVVIIITFIGKYSHIFVRYTLITVCINFMIFAVNPIILYLGSMEYRTAFNETFKRWMICSSNMFSYNKRKALTKSRPTSPSVIVLSFANIGCERVQS